ncbi:MAG: HlyD family efflux transporter periplasmic adaptor subunit [Bacteroidota bacterium]
MLNISENSITHRMDIDQSVSYKEIKMPEANRMLRWWLVLALAIVFVFAFLPWTQNIQANGAVTTLRPEQRPQTINSVIAGKIEKWYVQEGQQVQAGDTILFLSEIKSEYFDPDLIDRTRNQVRAKEFAIQSYDNKAQALDNQIAAYQKELQLKKGQLRNKIQQNELKINNMQTEIVQAENDYNIAEYQYRRIDTLYQKGIKTLTDLEGKRLKMVETDTKLTMARNKLMEAKNELAISKLQLNNVDNEYATKIAKAESDKYSALSNRFDAEGSLNKMKNEYENYSRRNQFYYVLAPQDCFITKALKPGIGEIVKEGEGIVSIVPSDYQLAVEIFVRPMDLPLIDTMREVRFIFDGWPAFVFAGWPDMSFGTYSGKVVAIDNIPSKDNKYRILISPNNPEKKWPKLLRVGSGAQGIALLNNVPLWYEVWRQLNGFPPDFYDDPLSKKDDDKFKPPVKAVAK